MKGRVLIIAGSDSGGGAGVQADIKTVTALGGYAATAITAITVQNTLGVSGVHPIPVDVVEAQARAVLDDIGADAIKTGMLGDAALVEAVAGLLAEARTGGDVQALRWATAACGLAEDAARCRKALARARVQAEPDNGLHWLEWAPEASSDEERAQAWQGLVRAQGWHEHPGGLTAVTQAALASMQPVPPAYLRARLARETLGRDASEVPEGQDWLESQCIRDRAGCAQVADRMSTEADSTALLLLAAALGRHVGWAQDRLDTLAATTQAFHARLPNWAEGPQAVLSCDAAERQLAHVEAVAKQGEVPRPRAGSRP